jgi:NTE family protein
MQGAARHLMRGRWSVPLLMLILATFGSFIGVARGEDAAADTSIGARPRIGLVLGGGGARGAAHIGVLHVLEELRVPVDCVAATSMGALVGAAYASGMSSHEIEKLVTAINWSETFGSAGTRDLQPVHIKTSHTTYSNKLEFGVKKSGLLAPGGLLASQQIDSLLRTIVSRRRYEDSFDDLPIPFRAIATDLGSGEMLILGGGDLSVAMRASMAVPGVFAPVRVDDRAVVDGGLVRNLPVDVARDMCADVIIASSLVSPTPDADQLTSALAVVGQMIDVMIKNNERAQLATLGPVDVPILISLPDMTSGDFEKVPTAIPFGEDAARAVAQQLSRYSLSPAAYAEWRAQLARSAASNVALATVTEIRVEGLSRVNPEFVRRQIETRVGEPFEEARVVTDAQRIFSKGDFEKVDYDVTESTEGRVLEFLPSEKPWGPDYLRFDLGLNTSFGGDTGFVLRADHAKTWINSLGGRWNSALQVGSHSLIETSLFQPLEVGQRFFVEPGLRLRRELEYLYRGDDRVARYERAAFDLELDAGMSIGTWGEFRVGLRQSQTDFTADTGALLLPEFRNIDSAGVTSRFVFDSRDSPFVATRGVYAHIDVYSAEDALGSDDSYQRAEFFAQKTLSFGDRLLYLEASGGSDFGTEAPSYDLFTLGGLTELAGFQTDELRGHEYLFGRVAYMRKVTDLRTLLGQSIYAGVSIEAGNMFDRIDGASARGAILGSSLILSGRTPLGPLVLAVGYAEGGQKAGYLQLGRPLKER